MRPITQSPSPQPQPPRTHILIPLTGAATTAFSLLLFLLVCFRKITRKRTAPEAYSKPPHRFSYSLLRGATDSFAPTRRLGQGGFGSVFFGTLPHTRQEVAVKLMDSGSLQGEREFQNELFFASMLDSPYVISVLGFSSDRKRRRMLLVYEFMSNGNLQDALLHRKCPELMEWKKRFSIDLVDKSIQGLEQKQALLCITVALVCLQKIPARRPSMQAVVGMLTGELEPPKLPPELTTSSQSRISNKSHKKVR